MHIPHCWKSHVAAPILCFIVFKSSNKQFEFNACIPKHKSPDWYALTCDVTAYHLAHFHSVWVIHKWQSGINNSILTLEQGHEENIDDQSSNVVEY